MWHPKQLLKEQIISALFLGGFSKLEIEFLGWLSYNASALNHSRNPVRAAHTILANASDKEQKLHRMLLKFRQRKLESINPPEAPKHEASDVLFRDLQSDIQDEIKRAEMLATGYEDYTKGGVSDGGEPLTSRQEGEPGEWLDYDRVAPVQGDEEESQ